VLHVAPEAFIGGPLALLQTGDIVRLDLAARRLDMLVPEEELAARRAAWTPPEPRYQRGWGYMFSKHVGQADTGCDFDFLTRDHGPAAAEPDIY
jgi:dihydroxy-acid dehydratase